MAVGEWMAVIGFAAVVIPPVVYLSVKLAAYGWLKGLHRYYEETTPQHEESEGDDSADQTRGT